MEKNIIIIYLGLAISIIGCNRNEKVSLEDSGFQEYFENKGNIPTVKGRIINLSEEELLNTELNYTLVTPFEQDQMQIKKTGKLNPDGTFSIEIDNPFPYQQIWLHVGDFFYAGIYANSDLFVELDADSLRQERAYMYGPGVNYSGTDGLLNTVLNKHVLFKQKEQQDIGKSISRVIVNRSLNSEEFLKSYDSLYMLLHTIDDKFISKNPSPNSWLIKNERMSEYYGNLCIRYFVNKQDQISDEIFDKIKKHKAYIISNTGSSFYNYLVYYLVTRSVKFNDIDYSKFIGFSGLTESQRRDILEYAKIKSEKDVGEVYDTVRQRQLERSIPKYLNDTLVVNKTLKTINLIDSLFNSSKADLLKIKLSSKDLKEKKLILETLLKHTKTEWVREVIQTNYNELINTQSEINEVLKKGGVFTSKFNIEEPILELKFGAKLYTIDSMEADAFLTNIKTAFKGKALILDFWATWCLPCLSDLPYSKKLHDQMKNEPVEFIYLCTSEGSDLETWKSKIIELKLGGIHIFVDKNIENKLMSKFKFSGYPGYAFINTYGDYKAGVITRMSYLTKDDLKDLLND